MTERLALFVLLALCACTGGADEPVSAGADEAVATGADEPVAAAANVPDPAGVSSLKVDLDAVGQTGKVVPVDGISAAGQPDAAQFTVFADNGYVAIIDLRTDGEDRGLDEPAVVEGLGMEYIPMPIGHDDITMEKARDLAELLDRYDEPVLVHCASSNRVGALLALKFYDETGDAELALEMGRAGGMRSLEDAVKKEMGVR